MNGLERIAAARHPAELRWRWVTPAGALVLTVAVGLVAAPADSASAFSRSVAAMFGLAALIEAGVGVANRSQAEGRAALVLSAASLAAALLLLVQPNEGPLNLINATILALVVRSLGAGISALLMRPVGKAFLLMRGAIEAGMAVFLVATIPLALVLTLPFATLNSIFFGGEGAGPPAAALFGSTIAVSVASGGVMFLLIGLRSRRNRRRTDRHAV